MVVVVGMCGVIVVCEGFVDEVVSWLEESLVSLYGMCYELLIIFFELVLVDGLI